MPLTDYIQVCNEGNLPETIPSEKLKPHIESAEIELKRILGLSLYKTIQSEDQSDDDGKVERYTVTKKAEALMALSFAVHALNIETSGTGIVSERGFGDSRSELLKRDDVVDLSEHFKTRAMNLLSPYMPVTATVDEDNAEVVDSYRNGGYRMSAI